MDTHKCRDRECSLNKNQFNACVKKSNCVMAGRI